MMQTICPAVLPYLYGMHNVHEYGAGHISLCLSVRPSVCLSACVIWRIMKFVTKVAAVDATMLLY